MLGRLDREASARAAAEIRAHGFCVLESRLDAAICDRLVEFSLNTTATPVAGADPSPTRYDRAHPSAVVYELGEDEVAGHQDVQSLICDPSLLAIAQDYLGVEPVVEMIHMWWSTAYLKEASDEAAQRFHFDLDRFGFLKFLCYLTPVGEQNGPHCFVEGSHRSKPQPLRRDGRLPDTDIRSHYEPSRIVDILGPKGTIFAVDTRGFHKGVPVIAGDRLALQIQFSTSLFGAPYRRLRVAEPSAELIAARRDHPRVFKLFDW